MKKKNHTFLIGAHMSIEGGLDKSLQRAHELGCFTLQLFTKSNRQWFTKPLLKDEIQLFKTTKKELSICDVVAHASYLINIGSPKIDVYKNSISALKKELHRCSELDIPYLVLHPGSALKTDIELCLERITKGLDSIFEQEENNCMILLETMAGQGSCVGYSFEQLATIRGLSKHPERIGICLDTCHIFAAGYDIRTEKTYKQTWLDFEKIIGIKHLKAMHINDSKGELGSRLDRHEHIGQGKIGKDAFTFLFNDEQFFDIPKILETPKEIFYDDEKNINYIRQLLTEKTKKELNI